MNSKYSIHYNKIIHSIHKYIHYSITGNSSTAQLNPIRSGLIQTANDPGGGGGEALKAPKRSRKLLCQSLPYHTCAFYQVF